MNVNRITVNMISSSLHFTQKLRIVKKYGKQFLFNLASGFELGFDHWGTICPLG